LQALEYFPDEASLALLTSLTISLQPFINNAPSLYFNLNYRALIDCD
jgi:hypothetical protein